MFCPQFKKIMDLSDATCNFLKDFIVCNKIQLQFILVYLTLPMIHF